jgi:hypothetical protein
VTEHPAGTSANPTPAQTGSGNTVRLAVRIILFAILLYLICALPYEFYVARPGNKAEYDKVFELVSRKNSAAGHITTTNKTIQEALKRKPNRTQINKSGLTQETYSWRRGLPFLTFNTYVTYYEKGDDLLLDNVFLNEDPQKAIFGPSQNVAMPTKPADGQTPPGPPGTMGAAMSPPPGVPPTGGRPPEGQGQPSNRPDSEDAPKEPAPSGATEPKASENAAEPKPAPAKPNDEAPKPATEEGQN